MSGPKILQFILYLALALTLVSCSSDGTIGTETNESGLVDGEVNPNAASFEYEIGGSDDPNRPGGPYILRGSNVRYDDALEALLVDLTVTNAGRNGQPMDVALTFLKLLPDDVTVLNPDNDENGEGAMILFEFENDDLEWSPGETSLPRAVAFGVEPETSIGFAARLDVGVGRNLGMIGGVVWHDVDQNGERDSNELGIAGVEVFLRPPNDDRMMGPLILRRTLTGNDGTYRFDNLVAGHYVVFKDPEGRFKPTTPAEINVVLVAEEDGVSDFLLADFGCIFDGTPLILPGDFVRVVGDYKDPAQANLTTGNIHAREVIVRKCGDRGCVLPGFLAGPVTDVNREDGLLRIMNEWVGFAERDSIPPELTLLELDPNDVEIGDRVSCNIEDPPHLVGVASPLSGYNLQKWTEEGERANGILRRVGGAYPSVSPVTLVMFRRTVALVTEDTVVHFEEN